jgi:hypothetical protein
MGNDNLFNFFEHAFSYAVNVELFHKSHIAPMTSERLKQWVLYILLI